ncbi:glycosyltransferase [Methanobrevibacter sp.]|uniref:glycosyltransferase n=1 Tax=Methanobrevibacter sp. TaxID=66852 RepID=UPI0038656F23
MYNIKVSVIIPIYNVEKYLKKCLDSVIHQTLNEIEIICIDDHSTDDSLLIIEEYAKIDSRVKIIKNDINKGVSTSRNLGIKEAKGEYIAFLDSDDFIDETAYEKAFHIAHKLDLDCLLFKTKVLDNRTGEISDKTPYFALDCFKNFDKEIFNHTDTKKFTCDINVQLGSKLFKREFIINNKLFFPQRKIFEDEDFFYNIYLRANRISLLPEHLYYYRRFRKGSIMENKNKRFPDLLDTVDELRKIFIKTNNFDDEYKNSFYKKYISLILYRFKETDEEDKEEFFLKTKEFLKKILFNEKDILYLDEENKLASFYILNSSYAEFSEHLKNNTSLKKLLNYSIDFSLDLNDSLQNKKSNLNDKNQIINSKNEIINSKNEIIDGKNNLIKKLKVDTQNTVKQLELQKNQVTNLNDTIEQKNTQITEKKAIITEKEEIITNINNQLELQKNQVINLNDTIEQKNTQITEKEEIINNLIENLKIQNKTILDLEMKLNNKLKIIESLENNNNLISEEILNKKSTIEEQNNIIESLSIEKEYYLIHYNSLKKNNAHLNNINEEVFSSNSWKLTEPLRKFRRILK